ncbi:dynein regulatory complex protein 9 [Vespa velutina]|uniref:dynein regulatory complex protein 9 n=1 Tax=Vespa velutina TaxID=202808 RepID=UPI001FB299BA|nr:dynein regulatory complex protein 9 [Vespa velutina]XP_047348019.1 dynein regulatory complex protein 9 [Vespa velutina]
MAEKKVNNLSELSSSKVAALSIIFEDCTNALVIYQKTLKQIFKRSKNTTVPYILYELENLETTDKQVLNEDMKKMIKDMQEQATYNKLHNDSLYIRRIMEELKEEIREYGSFDVLTKEIERIVTQRKKEETLFEEYTAMKKTAMELRQTIANEKMSNEAERTRLRNILLDLKNENEKLKIVNDIEHKYSCKWNEAKCQQNSIKCKDEWKRFKKTLDDLHEREKMEEIVFTELITFLIQDIASIEEKIEEWQKRYDQEKKMYEKEICEVNIEIET